MTRQKIAFSVGILTALIASQAGSSRVLQRTTIASRSSRIDDRRRGDSGTLVRLWTHDHAGPLEPIRTVVRDSGTLRRLWPRIVTPYESRVAVPSVNFHKEMVIIATSGLIQGIIRVDSIKHRTPMSASVVFDRIATPGSGCSVPAELYTAVDIIKVPRDESPILFHDTLIGFSCKPKNTR